MLTQHDMSQHVMLMGMQVADMSFTLQLMRGGTGGRRGGGWGTNIASPAECASHPPSALPEIRLGLWKQCVDRFVKHQVQHHSPSHFIPCAHVPGRVCSYGCHFPLQLRLNSAPLSSALLTQYLPLSQGAKTPVGGSQADMRAAT